MRARQPRADAFLDRARAGARARSAAVRRRRHAAHLLRRRRSVRRQRGGRCHAPLRRARAGDEVDRARRHRDGDQAQLRRARQGGLRLRVLPRVPQGGIGARRLPTSRPGGRRRRRRLGRRRRDRALRTARRPARADRRAERRDDQACRQRLPRHQDLVHQRDRQRVRGDGGRRARGGARDGTRPAHRHALPEARHWLRRKLFSQGCFSFEAARRQLWLPLPTADRRDRGQRAPEAACGCEASEAPGVAGGQADCAARPRLQVEHRRHARGVLARSVGAAAGGWSQGARV